MEKHVLHNKKNGLPLDNNVISSFRVMEYLPPKEGSNNYLFWQNILDNGKDITELIR